MSNEKSLEVENQEQEIKTNGVKDQYMEQEVPVAQKRIETKEEAEAFYNDAIPFMKLEGEYEELAYKHSERRVKQLELQVRELEAIGYLSQWKAGQDEAKRKAEYEEKRKAEWDAMTPEQQDEWKEKAKQNLVELDRQAKQATINEQDKTAD